MNFIFYFRPLLTIVLFVSSSLLLAQDFDLSRLPRVTNEGTIYDVYPTPDGKYIIVGNFDFIEDKPLERIARLYSDGTLDESFSTLPRWEDGILDVAISDSGEVFIALYIYANEGEHKVIKLKSDGSLDNDFIFNANQQVAVLGWNSGRLLAGGSFTKVNNTPTSRLVSITANGVLNSDFNANISIDHGIYDIGFQGEKIIISSQNGSLLKRLNSDGSTDQSFQYDYESLKLALGGNTLRYEMIVTTDSHIVIYDTFNGLIFLDADGVFINSKDNHRQITAMAVSNGVLYYTHALNENQYVFKYIIEKEAYDYLGEAKGRTFSMAVSNDHSVLLGGRINEFRSVKTYSIAKLDASDNPIEDFGIRDFYQIGSIYTLGLQGNDKLIIGGYFTKVNGVSVSNLARLNLDGSLDMDFTPFDNGGNAISKIQVTGDNKFYAIGNVWSPSSGFYMPGLHLINADGSYNKTIYPESVRDFIILNDQIIAHNFGYAKSINLTTNETVDFIKGTGPDQYHTVVSSKNGNVLVSGLFRDPSGYYTTLNSYLPDGTLDPNFNQLTVTKEGNNPTMEALQIAADGKIWVGGKFDTVNGVPAPSDGLIRLHPDGTLDSSFNPNGEGLNDGRSSTINYINIMNDGSAIIKGNDVTTYNNEKVGTSFIVTTGGELSKRTLPFNDHGAVFTGIPLDNNQYLYGGYFNLKSESLRTSLGILDLNEPITGVEDAESHLITLYPNPVRDYLTLQVPDQASVYFSIYSLTGQQVAVPAIQSSGDLQVDVQALPPGMYVLKGTGRSGNFYKKFIKQ